MDLEDGFMMKMDMDMYNMTNMTNGTMYDWMKCFSLLGRSNHAIIYHNIQP